MVTVFSVGAIAFSQARASIKTLVFERPTMTVSTPLPDNQGETIGVLAAHLSLEQMDLRLSSILLG
ncbi:hypothetical protein B9T07_01640 [Limnospira fusiformis CCALA 023]|uniref:Uncharacterized protein n=1 Tax=Limnospira platensis NIES-46 TaxID=1236695 RepID=A0A5M3T9P2_LIMPL|nr:hypothetical protein NIES39_M02220 [Arthrospira platensis NIES-39]BDT15300.1 hypothetical protein N39L_50230 [Arthrospira platensis NIES-39]GCE94680.1 hypothetical protein NIES46_27390 [Arthrospira platensis NIES-46]